MGMENGEAEGYNSTKPMNGEWDRSFLIFIENTVVDERNLLEKWGAHRG
jgi:hypothetical protein